MNKLFLLFVLLAISISSSQPMKINYSTKMQDYISKFNQKKATTHRSSFDDDAKKETNATKGTYDKSLDTVYHEENNELTMEKWNTGSMDEYKCVFLDNIQFVKVQSNAFIKNELEVSLNKTYNTLVILSKQKKFTDSLLNIDRMPKVASDFLHNYLPYFFNHVEYDITNKEFKNGKLDSVTVRFRRIFQNGIILKNTSFVELSMDKYGNICHIEIKWPKFIKIKNETSDFVSLQNSLEYLDLELAKLDKIIDPKTGSKYYYVDMNVTGVSLAWFPAEVGNEITLTPCYSYVSYISYENNVNINKIIDIPVFKKYYNQ